MDQDRYAILCSDFAEAQARIRKWESEARNFAQKFRSGFASYLGRPKHFQSIEGHDEPYVSLDRLSKYDGELACEGDPGNDTDIIVLNDDDEWVFAIGLRLATTEDNPLKHLFHCRCRFTIMDDSVRLYIGDNAEALTMNLRDTISQEQAFDRLYNHYRTWFTHLNTSPSKRQRMGFI